MGRFSNQAKNILPQKQSNQWIKKIMNNMQKDIVDERLQNHPEPYFRNCTALVKKALRCAQQERLDTKYRTQLVHLDLHMYNVLYNKKVKQAMIIDTEDLKNDILVREIAVILRYEITGSRLKNKRILRALLKGYESQMPLKKKEKQVIPLIMILRKFGEIGYLMGQYQKRILDRKECHAALKDTIKQLEYIVDQFDFLKQLFTTNL